MSNMEAMKRTHEDYIENIRAVKGEAHAKFVGMVVFILASSDCINYTIRTGDKRMEAAEALVTFTSRFITMLAKEANVPVDDVMALLEDARTMMAAVDAAADMPKIVLG